MCPPSKQRDSRWHYTIVRPLYNSFGVSESGSAADRRHHYWVYGMHVASDQPLSLPQHRYSPLCRVDIVHRDRNPICGLELADDASAPDSWFRQTILPDGSAHVRWTDVGEFLVSADGRQMSCRQDEHASNESFHVYMLGQALSYALVTQGVEPLHATAAVVDSQAVAFLGGNGFGKSTLAACFLEHGDHILTDDLLAVDITAHGVRAYPGPPRLKLFPRVARRLRATPAGPMNPSTQKEIFAIDGRVWIDPVPLRAVYVLAPPIYASRRRTVAIEPLPPRAAFLRLLDGAFNRRVPGRARLRRQFDCLSRLAERVPVKQLTYPRVIERLDEVRDAILSDLRNADRTRVEPAIRSRAAEGERPCL
jgi:hypothetical protein